MAKLYIGDTLVNKLHLGDMAVVPAFAEGATVNLPQATPASEKKAE